MFNNLHYWQRGAIFGFLMILGIVIVQFAALVANETRLEAKGLPHICTDGAVCGFVDASGGYGQAAMLLIIVLGMIAGVLGAIVGYLIDRFRIRV